jgi:glycosyltransferase involved in cell wall biosynthesis
MSRSGAYILHIGDQAGVACILAKYQRSQGYKSEVIKLSTNDKFGIYSYYRDYISLIASEEQFVNDCLQEGVSADIIHIHGNIDMLFRLRKKFGRTKKLILHYHGTDIRGLKKQKLPHRSRLSDLAISLIFTYRRIRNNLLYKKRRIDRKAQMLADVVIVSTPDLLQNTIKGSIYLPNPVDTDHFNPDKTSTNTKKQALIIDTEVTDTQWVLDYCKKNNIGLDIEVYDRINNPIMYKDIPSLLKAYNVYIDIRYVDKKILSNLSKTALEALACGLDVLDYRLNYCRGLASEHYPINVISQLSSLYFNDAL